MKLHTGKMADAASNSYTVHEAFYYDEQGSTTVLVAVPFPYCTTWDGIKEICEGVVGHACQQERQFIPTVERRREAIENTREVYPDLFPKGR